MEPRRDYNDRFVSIDPNWNRERDDAEDNWDQTDWGPDDWDDQPDDEAEHHWNDGPKGWNIDPAWNPAEWDSVWTPQRPGRPAVPGDAAAEKPKHEPADLSKSGNEWGHSAQNLTAQAAGQPSSEEGNGTLSPSGLDSDGGAGAGGNATGGGGDDGGRYRGDCRELDETVCSAMPRCSWSFFTGCSLRARWAGRRDRRVYVERDYPANPVAETMRDMLTGDGLFPLQHDLPQTWQRVYEPGTGGVRDRARHAHRRPFPLIAPLPHTPPSTAR